MENWILNENSTFSQRIWKQRVWAPKLWQDRLEFNHFKLFWYKNVAVNAKINKTKAYDTWPADIIAGTRYITVKFYPLQYSQYENT